MSQLVDYKNEKRRKNAATNGKNERKKKYSTAITLKLINANDLSANSTWKKPYIWELSKWNCASH